MTFDLKMNFPPIPIPGGAQFIDVVGGLPKLLPSGAPWKTLPLTPSPTWTGDRVCCTNVVCGSCGVGIEIWVKGEADEGIDMVAVGDTDDGGELGRAAKYFATISMTPDHWLPSSGILEGLKGVKERNRSC